MIYTGIHGHLSEVYVQAGDQIEKGQKIGKMGSTGVSTANHDHFGLIPGRWKDIFRMDTALEIIARMTKKEIEALFLQYHYFLDYTLFGITKEEHRDKLLDLVITSGFGEPKYGSPWLFHVGFDIVPSDRFKTEDHFGIHHNRSHPGTIIKTSNDTGEDAGYGKYILFQIEV